MAILFTDGCDHGSFAAIETKWDTVSSGAISGVGSGVFGGGSIAFDGAGTTTTALQRDISTPLANIMGISFWFKITQGDSSTTLVLFQTLDAAGDYNTSPSFGHDGISINCISTTGTLQFRRFGTSGVTASTNVSRSNWHHIEIWTKSADTGGYYEVWVNREKIVDIQNGDTVASGTPLGTIGMRFVRGSASFDYEIDDFVVWDDRDFGRTNDLTTSDQGPLRIDTLRPNAAGTNTNWNLTGAASNYEAVDEATYTSTDYVSATADGTKDTYNMAAPTTSVGTILAAVTNAASRRDNAAARYLDGVCVSSNSTATGGRPEQVPLSTADALLTAQSVFTVEPSATSAWTTATLDTAEFGFQFEETT